MLKCTFITYIHKFLYNRIRIDFFLNEKIVFRIFCSIFLNIQTRVSKNVLYLYSQLTWKFKHTYVSWLSNNCHDTIMMWALRPLCKYQMTYFSLSLLQVEKWSWTSCRRGCTASTRSQCSWRNGKTCQIWQPRGWSQISYWSGLEK